jgi:hypothetical protein
MAWVSPSQAGLCFVALCKWVGLRLYVQKGNKSNWAQTNKRFFQRREEFSNLKKKRRIFFKKYFPMIFQKYTMDLKIGKNSLQPPM